jgi:hypothetical protein
VTTFGRIERKGGSVDMTICICNTLKKLYCSVYGIDQRQLQHTLENTLFTYCDDIQPDQIGVHWSFDWLFAPREAFALSVGRWFELNERYCHITFKHQSNATGGTIGTGVVYELRLPLGTFQYNEQQGRCSVDYAGPVEYQVRRLQGSSPSGVGLGGATTGQVVVSMEKKLNRASQRWSNVGTMTLSQNNGSQRCSWEWSYEVETIVDRPDYDLEVLLPILKADLIPSGNGHLMPAMRSELTSGSFVKYTENDEASGDPVNDVHIDVEGAYLDGNFGLSSSLDSIVKDRWAWMAAPQLWHVDGSPAQHMMTFGFYNGPILPNLGPEAWSGAILWRSRVDDMTRFSPWTLLDDVNVRFHSPRYLDVTIIPVGKSHRVTVRAWSHTMTTPLTTPSGRPFHDHQDLLADAYVVVEQNTVPESQRCWRRPKWAQTARLVTNMFGFEFGEQERVIGTPGYPAYDAVPDRPAWFVHALSQIPGGTVGQPTPAPRLSPLNGP